jgi:hypothetical protein
VRLKLLEALYFTAHFAVDEELQQKRLWERHVELAEATVRRVEDRACAGCRLDRRSVEERAHVSSSVPEAAPAHFWAAIGWGAWGMSHSRLDAASKGVARRVRDHARIVSLIDESYAAAGGLRLLGRLHTAAPRVPFVTGWIDRHEGLRLLERANRISQQDPRNPLFLAQAILQYEPERGAEARRLLEEVARRTPEPIQLVEQTEIIDEARRELAALEPAR